MKTYKVLSALLDYPGGTLLDAVPTLRLALDAEALLPPAARAGIEPLLRTLEQKDLFDLQEGYVGLFDRVRSLSLHLFEHVHGESRDRGQALVDLKALYARNGLALAPDELPDYLPAFLEFLSRVPAQEAARLLAETAPILEGIGARLAKRRSSYAGVFDALLALAGVEPEQAAVSDEEIRKEDDPAALDAAWEEQPAFGSARGCESTQRPEVSVLRFQPRADPRATPNPKTNGA